MQRQLSASSGLSTCTPNRVLASRAGRSSERPASRQRGDVTGCSPRALDNSFTVVIVCGRGADHSNYAGNSGSNRYAPAAVLNGHYPSLVSCAWIDVMKIVRWHHRLCLDPLQCCSAPFWDPGGDLVPIPFASRRDFSQRLAAPAACTNRSLLTFLVRLQEWLMVIPTFPSLVSSVDLPHPSGLHVRLARDTCILDPPGPAVPGLLSGKRPKLFLPIDEQGPCSELAARSFCYLGREVQPGPQA